MQNHSVIRLYLYDCLTVLAETKCIMAVLLLLLAVDFRQMLEITSLITHWSRVHFMRNCIIFGSCPISSHLYSPSIDLQTLSLSMQVNKYACQNQSTKCLSKTMVDYTMRICKLRCDARRFFWTIFLFIIFEVSA